MSDLFGGLLPTQPVQPQAAKRAPEVPAVFGTAAWVWCYCGRPNSIHFAASGLRRCMQCAIDEGRGYRTDHAR